MTSLFRHGRRPLFVLAAATCVAVSTMGALGAGAAVRPASAGQGAAGPRVLPGLGGTARGTRAAQPSDQIYATLFFSRSEITAADGCAEDDTGIARLDTTVAPYLQSLGMTGTGSLVTKKTHTTKNNCTHGGDSLTASWDQATSLAQSYGWSFVSATATYPANISSLTPAQQQAETCGSARAIDEHGLPGAHGLIAYPGAQGMPTSVQANYGAKCFAWGREYEKSGTTTAAMGITPPFWQFTRAFNGGPCNDPSAPCYTIDRARQHALRDARPDHRLVDALQPGQWLTLQSYILVTGKNPPYLHNGTRWNCTSPEPGPALDQRRGALLLQRLPAGRAGDRRARGHHRDRPAHRGRGVRPSGHLPLTRAGRRRLPCGRSAQSPAGRLTAASAVYSQERQRLLQVQLDLGGGVRQVADRGVLPELQAEVAAPGGQRDGAGDRGRPDDVAVDQPPQVLRAPGSRGRWSR